MLAVMVMVLSSLIVYGGRLINRSVPVLRDNNIPAPVVGGLVFACVSLYAHETGWRSGGLLPEDMRLALSHMLPFFMLLTFAAVGLNASARLLIEGGRAVATFLVVATLLLIMQNTIGVVMALIVGLDIPIGLMAGSITLSGGHDTGFAWSQYFSKEYNITAAKEIAFVCATFGLIAGALLGGRIVRMLMEKNRLMLLTFRGGGAINQSQQKISLTDGLFKNEHEAINAFFVHITALLVCVLAAYGMAHLIEENNLLETPIPSFIWAILTGIFIRNMCELCGWYKFDTRFLSIIGAVALALFLGLAMMSLKLWQLASLFVPLLIILLVQIIAMACFAYFVTYRFMGRDYDAAVIAGGHCGFGMGATPTALAIIHAVGERYGISSKALLVVPLVGAFFIDIVNVSVIYLFLTVFG